MTIVEISTFPHSDVYLTDPVKGDEWMQWVADDEKGALKIYMGVQTDARIAYVVIAWESLETHKKYMADTVRYTPVVEKLTPMIAPTSGTGGPFSEVRMYHADLANYEAVFAHPVTSFSVFTLKAGASSDTVRTQLKQLTKALNDSKVDASWGPVVDQENTFSLVAGWPTVAAHSVAVKVGNVAAGLAKLSQETDIHTLYATLKAYSP